MAIDEQIPVPEDIAPAKPAIADYSGWLDANPFYLMILTRHVPPRVINQDLGERGWIARLDESGLLYTPGDWYLVRKADNVIVLTMVVHEGERPYYVARHVGLVPSGDPPPEGLEAKLETIAYGIGKARADGHSDRVWIMANGGVTVGDDVEEIAMRLLMQGLMPDW
jgi:hypothetical protein